MQLNGVTSETMCNTMAHPENHRNLLARISGYTACIVTLNHDLQLELVARTEYRL